MKRLGCLAIAGCLVACGGSSSGGPEASGGSTTTGGTSSSSAGKGSGSGGIDERPPASQGALTVTLKSVSPAPAGKSCPSGTASTWAIPPVDQPNEALSNVTYLHWLVDGDAGAKVSCKVAASGGGVRFEGKLQQASVALQISEGTLGADRRGTARITVTNSQALTSALSSTADCVVSAARTDGNLQAQPGSMWASFSCAAVEAPPSDLCAATGIFVLENCDQ